jgi:hypothetical protein
MKFPLLDIYLFFLALLIIWFLAQSFNGVTASLFSGTSIIGMLVITALIITGSWLGCNKLHHLKYQEYAPRADSFVTASDNAIFYWGKIDGPIRSYSTIRDTFLWRPDSPVYPAMKPVLEAKGTPKLSQEYYSLYDSLESALPDTVIAEPMQHLACRIFPNHRYLRAVNQGLQFSPAVKVRSFTFVYGETTIMQTCRKEPG